MSYAFASGSGASASTGGSSNVGGDIAAGGGVIGGLGSLYSGLSQAASLDAQANLAGENAQVAVEQGDYDAYTQGIQAAQRIGAAKATYGSSGVVANQGSALAVLSASAVSAEMDRQNILNQAKLKAINYQNQASIDQSSAASATIGGYFGLAGGLVSGAGEIAGS